MNIRTWFRNTVFALLGVVATFATTGTAIASPPPGSKVWLRADADVTVSNGLVSNWLDQSGNANHAWMTTVTRRPTLVNGAINGLPVIRFNGAQSLLLTSAVTPTNFTILIVGKNNMPTETYSMILGPGGSTANNQLRWENGSQVLTVGTGNNMPARITSIGNTRINHVLAVRYNGSTMEVYRNGAWMGSHNFTTTGPWTLLQIGAWYSSHFMRGDLAEVLIYDTALSNTNLNTATNYLRSKYAL
jgi:hypothetical protein